MEGELHRSALDALGDGNRRSILEILATGAGSVQEIADRLPISRPAVSRHLRLLKEAGLVADRPEGTRRVYELRAEGVEACGVKPSATTASRPRTPRPSTRETGGERSAPRPVPPPCVDLG
jgi:DNA-binding transcriptional ArsR family regulator